MIWLVLLSLTLLVSLLWIQVRRGEATFRRWRWYSWEDQWTIADRDTSPIGFWLLIGVQGLGVILLIRVVYLVLRMG